MSTSRNQKDQGPLSDAGSIPALLGNRVRKRRAPAASEKPSKRVKTSLTHAAPSKSTTTVKLQPSSSAAEPRTPVQKATSGSSQPSKSPRQLRLTEMLKRERVQRLRSTTPEPRIVRGAPHMDSRRPKPLPSPTRKRAQPKVRDDKLLALLSSPVTRHAEESRESVAEEESGSFVSSTSLASTRVACPGTEALTYSRSMLPKSHSLLLDIFAGIETAVNLLRTRRETTTFGSVRAVVAQSSKRQFTFRQLSQLACLVPEALCVLPSKNPRHKTREHLVLRLDEVNNKSTAPQSKTSTVSFVGGAATRGRRKLLHNRLLEHVREQHNEFLEHHGIKKFESVTWHEDFDVETVPELAAPPLYPVAPPVRKNKPVEPPRTSEAESIAKTVQTKESKNVEGKVEADIRSAPPPAESKPQVDECIPSSLLERVRARNRARTELASAKDVDYCTSPDYLGRLPSTMDTIASILRNERRQAFGWASLVDRVVKDHPRKWDAEEVERQMNSIVEIASEWCSKIALTGPKLRYAFRLLNERKFEADRAKVVSVGKSSQV